MANSWGYGKKKDEDKNEVSVVEEKVSQPIQFEQQPVIIKTEIDAYIGELSRGGPQTLDDVKVSDVPTGEGKHRLSLSPVIEEKYGKRFAFRWVNKKKDWIDRALNVRQWVIVNRVLFKDLPRHLFTANGTIENGDTILCFMRIEQAERLRREPGRISSERVKDLPMEKWKQKGEDSPFYKPDLGSSEKEGEVLASGIQPDVTSNE